MVLVEVCAATVPGDTSRAPIPAIEITSILTNVVRLTVYSSLRYRVHLVTIGINLIYYFLVTLGLSAGCTHPLRFVSEYGDAPRSLGS